MFRFHKILSQLTQTAYQNKSRPVRNQMVLGRPSIITMQRYYGSKKNDKSCPPKEPTCKTPEPKVPKCTVDTIHPCAPKSTDCNYGRKPLPLHQDCPAPNRMDQLPELQCPYEKHNNAQRKKYLIVLMIGSVLFFITCAVLYRAQKPMQKVTKEKKTRPKIVRKVPPESKDIPNSIPYLLIGGGTASFSAFRAIKSTEPQAKVLVISNEDNFPYMRPPLSKEIWFNNDDSAVKSLIFKQWNGSERSLFYEPDDFYVACKELNANPNGGVAVAKGWNVAHLDVTKRKAYLEDGYEINYDKCLIATGASPKNLDIFAQAEPALQNKVTLYREIFDFQEMSQIINRAESIAIIGGGFLGSELACSLARKGGTNLNVYQIFKENGNMGKILPEYLSTWTTEKVKQEGVQVIPSAEVTGANIKQDKVLLNLSNNMTVTADHVIVSIGVTPNTEMAFKSELEIDPELGGYLVNTELQARSHLFIAGDCACFYDTKLGRRRVEHHDHAVVSGRLAGENMTGSGKPYWHQSMFWSDLGPDVGYEAIGIVDSSLPTVGVFAKATSSDNPQAVVTATDESMRSATEECDNHFRKDPEQKKLADKLKQGSAKSREDENFGKGVIFYLRDDIVVGIVLWNVFNRMNIARQVLKDERKYDDLNEVAKLFNIHEEVESTNSPES